MPGATWREVEAAALAVADGTDWQVSFLLHGGFDGPLFIPVDSHDDVLDDRIEADTIFIAKPTVFPRSAERVVGAQPRRQLGRHGGGEGRRRAATRHAPPTPDVIHLRGIRMEHERSQIADLFSVGHKAGAWGDLPATPADFDPQILVSRNEGVQPFFLTCERDSLVVTLSGDGFVEFRDSNVLHFRVAPGDFVYVPAGTPHRIRAEGPMVQLRFKALHAGSEVVSWHCPECSTELWHREFDSSSEIAQRVYLEATNEFNSNESLRRCATCAATHPVVDVAGTHWDEVAAFLDTERAAAPARATKGDRLPPAKDREPLRTNVYELMRGTTTQLLPLFPYLGPGAMLPAGALFRGRPDANYGRFFHRNSEEEVNVCFGAQQALGAAGVMFIGGKMHEVQAPLLDTNDPNAFMVAVITQRQQDEGRAQKESVIFRCSECNKKLHQVDYSAELPDPDRPDLVTGGRVDDEYEMFPTMWGSILATDSFNSDEKARTCTECGHVNAPFPEEAWGWQNYVDRHEVVNSARHLLDESARKAEAAASAV